MYTIIEQSFVRSTADGEKYRVTLLVDTAEDVPEVNAAWEPGSICMIAATHTYKMLNNGREWA